MAGGPQNVKSRPPYLVARISLLVFRGSYLVWRSNDEIRATRYEIRLPGTGVRHRLPRLAAGQGVALLQELDRDPVRRADESHVPIARRAVDGHAEIHQALADRVDVVDGVGEVAKIAPARIGFGVPVVGQLDLRRRILVGTE